MLPLARRRILVTRAPHQASELADRLRELGAIPILIPTIEIAPPASLAGLDAGMKLSLTPFHTTSILLPGILSTSLMRSLEKCDTVTICLERLASTGHKLP